MITILIILWIVLWFTWAYMAKLFAEDVLSFDKARSRIAFIIWFAIRPIILIWAFILSIIIIIQKCINEW